MKTLLLGNEAVARGLYEGGCTFVSSYPGTPSTEITEAAARYPEIYAEWAPNEKVAMEAAFGASLAGRRSFCGMKHVGLNVAADPLFTISYTGINGGMIIGVADDAGMHSSQNEQDSRHYAKAAKLPMLEPSDSAEALEFTKLAYELSESFDTPVIMKMCTRISHSQSTVVLGEREDPAPRPYEKDGAKYIMMPGNAKRRHPVVEERLKNIARWAEHASVNRIEAGQDYKMGIITSSTSYQYVKEACGNTYPVLKLGMVWPLPEKKIIDFAKTVSLLVVVEELDGFIEEHCRKLGLACAGKDHFSCVDELSQNIIAEQLAHKKCTGIKLNEDIPPRPPVMCAGCPHRGLFYTLKQNRLTVLGDIGCYTLGAVAPLGAMDTTICMGSSISTLHGMEKARGKEYIRDWVAVIGDSTFMHTGINSLMNMVYNQSCGTVVILDNSTTGMTGHQDHAATGKTLKGEVVPAIDILSLCRSLGIEHVYEISAFDLEGLEEAFRRETKRDAVSVIVTKAPCVLLKGVTFPNKCVPIPEKCRKCGACLRPGCPALTKNEDGTISIDETMCNGCGLCAKLCRLDAIEVRPR